MISNTSFLIRTTIISIAIIIFFFIFGLLAYLGEESKKKDDKNLPVESMTFIDDTSCNVAVIPIFGEINSTISATTTSDIETRKIIDTAAKAENIKAILLDIDSSGGYMYAADNILNALDNATQTPKIAQIHSGGLSAAYFIALGAEKIFAQKTSDVGSIGVTQSYTSSFKKGEKDGEEFVDISTGPYKTLGEPNRKITDKEIKFLKDKLQKSEDLFIDEIAKRRNLSTTTVAELATGEVWSGIEALELKLIDFIGYNTEVEAYLRQYTGLDEVKYCY
jgi:protease IV